MTERDQVRRTVSEADSLSGLGGELDKKSREFVRARGVRGQCRFRVFRQGRWFVFDGRVDSQSTKCELFRLAPEVDGARWIVDKLRIEERPKNV